MKRTICGLCGEKLNADVAVCPNCGFVLRETAGNVVSLAEARLAKTADESNDDSYEEVIPTAEQSVQVLAPYLVHSLKNSQVAVAVYQDVVLAVDGESPYDREVPTAILFLDRFNNDVLDSPFWETQEIDLDGLYDVFSVNSFDLLQAVQNRLKVEGFYEAMKEARERRTVSIYEARFPEIRRMIRQKQVLPDLTVIVQHGQTYHVFDLPHANVLVDSLVAANVWPDTARQMLIAA